MNSPHLAAEPGGAEKALRVVVAVGASAGGLEACRALLSSMPAKSGIAFVIVMHLDPDRESHVAEILSTSCALSVSQVTGAVRVQADHVYVIAPDTVLELRDGVLMPHEPRERRGLRRPVDAIFGSLAADQGPRAVAIVMAGAGSDGAQGVREVHARGGLVLVQDPATAEYDAMPKNAIETGVVDRVAPPDALAQILVAHAAESPEHRGGGDERGAWSEAFGDLLDLLGRAYRVDFRGSYRRDTLWRRIERRMAAENVPDVAAYLDLLRDDPGRLASLHDDVLIGVTEFFRDPEIWAELANDLLPQLLDQHEDGTTLKMWVPGCATGEEAYGLAILVHEAMERTGRRSKLQIFATDISERALAHARRGAYPEAIADAVSPERLKRFFVQNAAGYEVRAEIRECITFAIHNLLADPPFTRLDLVSCRNLLIYLEPHAQQRVFELLQFACRPGGLLVLGTSETIGGHGDAFEVVSPSSRIYRARSPAAGRLSRWQRQPVDVALRVEPREATTPPSGPSLARAIEQLVLGCCTTASVVVTEALHIHSRFGPTERYLTQPTGQVRLDVLAWAKPGIYPRLRAALEEARAKNEKVTIGGLRLERGDTGPRVECTVEPIVPLARAGRMFLVTFRDLPPPRSAQQDRPSEGEDDALPAEALRAELDGMRRDLDHALDELDDTNEAYRASHEELMTLNEELQSNNEALEASKEELQSLNEEMVTVNRMLEDRNRELREVSTDLGNLLVSTDIPVVFLDRELRIRRFTPATRHLIHLVATDVGRPLAHIKGAVAEESLVRDAQRVLAELEPVTTEVTAEDGRMYSRSVRPYRSEDGRVDGVSVAFYDVTERKKAATASEDARVYAEAIVGTMRDALLVLDGDLRVVTANRGFTEAFELAASEVVGVHVLELPRLRWDGTHMQPLLESLLADRDEVLDHETTLEVDGRGHRDITLNARRMTLADRGPLVVLSMADITERRRDQRLTEEHAHDLVQEHRRKDEFLAMLGHELRNPLAAVMFGLDLWRVAGDDPERLGNIREMMTRQATRIAAMLDQLLDVARLTADKIEIARVPVDLVDAVQAAVEAVTPVLRVRGHDLTVTLPPRGQAIVEGDAGRLSQIVENLLSNAAKYTPDHGSIAVSVERDEGCARIRVRDTGTGIECDLLPHVFELFTQDSRTLDRAAGGLGLGLPIVQRLAQMHGGGVEASSEGRGKGSEFVVTLPRIDVPVEPAGAAAGMQPPRRPHVAPHRILVVDDEEDAAAMLADILALEGHETHAVHDGASALQAVRDQHPDVVLLDLGLPEIDGYEVARRLREEHGDEPILLVAITGYQADPERLEAAGFDRHLLKPTDLDALRVLVAEWHPESAAHERPA
jgi:two-component system CheB/CheR fusion protein